MLAGQQPPSNAAALLLFATRILTVERSNTMKTTLKNWPLSSSFSLRDRIDTNPDYQRPAVWSRSQKQLLIDTILRGYDIPKLYWSQSDPSGKRWEVVDGQQRLRAIWEFMDGEFAIPKNADDVEGESIAGLKYSDLSVDMRLTFDQYQLSVVVVEHADEDEIREMFLRLQNGTSLKAQEKRNAYPGAMRDFVKECAEHRFFDVVGFSNTRYSHDHIAAQLVALEMAGGPTNVKNADLNKLYRDHQRLDLNCKQVKSVRRTLERLASLFPEKMPELERFNVVALYCVLAELERNYAISDEQHNFKNWFIDFEVRRRAEEARPVDEMSAEWISYKEKISHSTDAEDSIRARMEFMLRDFLSEHPDVPRKDAQREFTNVQKVAIFRRDGGLCQLKIKCNGDKVEWDNWHCDHRVPHSKGGPTNVANGQVACAPCNLSKGAEER